MRRSYRLPGESPIPVTNSNPGSLMRLDHIARFVVNASMSRTEREKKGISHMTSARLFK
jgi:hypothetical protein